MGDRYLLNPTLEVVPVGGGDFELRCPLWNRKTRADTYQVGLLQQFNDATSAESVLAELPFHKEASRAFLQACVANGILMRAEPDGSPRLLDTVRPEPTVAATPHFDPASPPAFCFLGVPYDVNTTGLAGAKFGPASIRAASESARYRLDPHTFSPVGFHDYASGRRLLEGITLADAGDVFISPGERPEVAYDRITEVMRRVVESGAIPLVMGGDHSVTYPLLRAVPADRVGIIHFDAHTDLGEPMPGAGLHHGNVFTHVLDRLEYVEKITSFGLRGVLDATEHSDMKLVEFIGVDQVRQKGVDALIASIPDDMPHYISVDIDVLDPVFAPSTGTPVPNGLHPHELKTLLRAAARHRQIIGADVVEVAQPSGPADGTAGLAFECLLTVADGIVQGMQDRLAQHAAEPTE